MVRRETVLILLITFLQCSTQAAVNDAKEEKKTKPVNVNTEKSTEAVVDDTKEGTKEEFENVNNLEITKKVKKADVNNVLHYNPYPSEGVNGSEFSRWGNSVVFTRWGHYECPESTVMVYSGTMAGKYYNNYGSGGNYLCLPKIPKYDLEVIDAGSESDRGRLYPVEYRSSSGPLSSSLHDDVPCAVCLDEYRSTSILYPARDDCPSGWTREYYGFLMSARYDSAYYYSTEYVCVDAAGKAIPNTSAASNTAFIYTVEATCVTGGGIKCDPYVTGYELSCAVCAK
ncbi:uncharacterized protein LOC100367587 [Saccoglossus kowalevskii]|uniref:Short-chain collagen C4-like n=1 Tax=Saccoglossus kowalevskii TaxID=10224 RepID=A0ABM0GW57_SACKO|nr:PREDICTED: short-chain collagen C4-like [Saccoglossus kowalevskii]